MIEYGAAPKNLLADERFNRQGFPVTSVDYAAEYGGSLFERFDGNGDGKMSLDEARAGYSELDRNGDGKVGGLFSKERAPYLPWVAPKQLDYRAPETSVGVTNW